MLFKVTRIGLHFSLSVKNEDLTLFLLLIKNPLYFTIQALTLYIFSFLDKIFIRPAKLTKVTFVFA